MKPVNPVYGGMTAVAWGLIAVGILTTLGCRGGEPVGTSVQGTVTYQGKPLDRGVVMFIPVEANLSARRADIRLDGTYDLTAIPGEYKITVTLLADSTSDVAPDDPRHKPPKSLLPARYSSLSLTPLKQTVSHQASVIDLNLSSD